MNKAGPQPMSHDERLALAGRIAEDFKAHFGDEVRAMGIYGSLARGTDSDYSDIEMYCILKGSGIDTPYEWSSGAWKAEVNVQSLDVLLDWASEFEETWPLTHGSCVDVLVISDPENLFPEVKARVFEHAEAEFEALIRLTIVGELYEFIGKLRNIRATGNASGLAMQAVNLAKYGALVIGLANRHLYRSASTLFQESLDLPNRPEGYDTLCDLVMHGRLSDAPQVLDAADAFWSGIEDWADARGMRLHQNLKDVLRQP